MSRTNNEIYTMVAEELELIGVESLDADTLDKISRRETSVREWLINEGLVYWLSDAIPEAAALPYAQIVAGQCAQTFGRGPNSSSPYLLGDIGFRALERHVSKRSDREPVQAEYF